MDKAPPGKSRRTWWATEAFPALVGRSSEPPLATELSAVCRTVPFVLSASVTEDIGDFAGSGCGDAGAVDCLAAAACRCSLKASFEIGAYAALGKVYKLQTATATSSNSDFSTLNSCHHAGLSGSGTCVVHKKSERKYVTQHYSGLCSCHLTMLILKISSQSLGHESLPSTGVLPKRSGHKQLSLPCTGHTRWSVDCSVKHMVSKQDGV